MTMALFSVWYMPQPRGTPTSVHATNTSSRLLAPGRAASFVRSASSVCEFMPEPALPFQLLFRHVVLLADRAHEHVADEPDQQHPDQHVHGGVVRVLGRHPAVKLVLADVVHE